MAQQVSFALESKATSAHFAIEKISKILAKNKMPVFMMFSRLDKNLLRFLLIRATEFSDEEIEGLRENLFGNLA